VEQKIGRKIDTSKNINKFYGTLEFPIINNTTVKAFSNNCQAQVPAPAPAGLEVVSLSFLYQPATHPPSQPE
jgi:hypothetical protein